MRYFGLAICAAATLSMSASMVSAAVLFQDSFTADTANTGALNAGTTANYPALQVGEPGKLWMSRTPAASASNTPIAGREYSVQVRNDDPVAPGNNYLALFRNTVTTPLASGGTFGYAHAQLTADQAAANVGNRVTVATRMYIGAGDLGATAANTGELFRLIGQEETTIGNYNNDGDLSSAAFTNGTFGVRFFRPATGSDTRAIAVQSGGLVTTGDTTPLPIFKLNEWNDIVVQVDLGAAVPFFTVQVSNSAGSMTSAQQKIWTTFGTTLGTVSFHPFNDVLARVDNVSITPEPASLMASSALMLLTSRRRRFA